MFETLMGDFKKHPTKFYLLLVNVVAVIFLIVFQNTDLLPFQNSGDFIFFVILGLLLAVYRPGWCFVFFVGFIALENINLAPKSLPLTVRPYQLLALLTFVGIFGQYVSKRLPFKLPRFHWADAMAVLFVLAGFVSAIFSSAPGASFKQALVALSFVLLYSITRIYVQSMDDLKKILPFLLSGGLVVVLYGIWQNVRYLHGANSFEVMPGRPNATFTEADWLGIFLVFLLSILLTAIYYHKNKSDKFLVFSNWLFLALIFVLLILTVSRSAWIGALIVTIGFLKVILLDGSLKFSDWQWKKFANTFGLVALSLFVGLGIVYVFHLTTFQLGNRAQSSGGLQKITISCGVGYTEVPQKINSLAELDPLGCRHINLEEIEKEKVAGNNVKEIYRPDPNIGIRGLIYQKSLAEIKAHPILGIGWGNMSKTLGTDERGAGLNASNIFLETWLGAGLVGFLSLVILLGYIFYRGVVFYLRNDEKKQFISIALLLPWTAIVIPNLFNSGIFLGFVWLYLAIAVSLLSEDKV